MAARFWVGGSGTWSTTNTTNWSATSGGAGGASVPGAADDVTIDGNSGSPTVTTNYDASVISVTINAAAATLSLGGTLTCSGAITLTAGTFTTNNFNVTATQLASTNSNARTINLGSSTVTLSSGNSAGNSAINFVINTNLNFNAGTSSIVCSANSGTPSIIGGAASGTGVTFYNVSFTGTSVTNVIITSSNTFNNFTVSARSAVGVTQVTFDSRQTINGTLTLTAGTNATMRTFVRSDTIGTTRTLTCAAVASLTDIDFRDITIAGAAAPVSGTRLGDCKGNSGITFDAAKTVYRVGTGANWSSSANWSNTSGGTGNNIYFPLAQDTAIFDTNSGASGVTKNLDFSYNIGTIDMSARTSNTMTLATGSTTPTIYGNWINGTGTTITGTGTLTFAGRGSQTITSAGKTFTQRITTDSPSGSVTLQDALNISLSSSSAFNHVSGTFDANGYSVTISGASGGAASQGAVTRTLAIGSGTWTLSGTGGWNISGSNLTVTGTGTISLTSASAKTFAGNGIQTYPTLNQGGTGTLTVSGSNKFTALTNTAIGRIQFTGGTTNQFASFTISGVLGTLLQLGSTNTTQAILIKPTAWNMGVLSTDAGNNTGLNFLSNDGTMEYLSVSYINGQISAPSTAYAGNFFVFFS
jgi:hypothetical protein